MISSHEMSKRYIFYLENIRAKSENIFYFKCKEENMLLFDLNRTQLDDLKV